MGALGGTTRVTRAPPPRELRHPAVAPLGRPAVSQRATGSGGVPARKAQPRSRASGRPSPLGRVAPRSRCRLRGRRRSSSLSRAAGHVVCVETGASPTRPSARFLTLTERTEPKLKAAATGGTQPSRRRLARGQGRGSGVDPHVCGPSSSDKVPRQFSARNRDSRAAPGSGRAPCRTRRGSELKRVASERD